MTPGAPVAPPPASIAPSQPTLGGTTVRVALIDDDEDMRVSTGQLLSLAGFAVDAHPAAAAALAAIDGDYPGVVVTDVRMPGMSGIALFETLRLRDPTLPVILITGHADVAMAVDALKAGAWDFLAKPFDPAALTAAVTRAATARGLEIDNRRLRALADADEASALIGQAPAIRRLRDMIPVLGDADIDLLIEGETGTGKELLARTIHRAGKRARRPFLPLACAALPDALIDGALFDSVGEGSIAAAQGGTLFLDDIDRAPRRLQERLGVLVEDRAIRNPRSREAIPLDIRVIATSADATQRAADAIDPALFYRLAAVRLRLPPLRERREDVPLLFAHLLDLAAARSRAAIPTLTARARDHLTQHDWPGNVRELAHFADRLVLGLEPGLASPSAATADAGGSLPDRIAAFERQAIVDAVVAAGGEIGVAIDRLGLPRKTFYYKVQRLGIDLRALRPRRQEIAAHPPHMARRHDIG